MQTNLFDGIPMFAALTVAEREDLARFVSLRELPAGETLFWIGDVGEEFFVVSSGKIAISYPDESGQELTLAVLGPGDFFGELAILDGGPRTATARAVGDASVISLDRESFHRFIRAYPSAAIHMMTVLGKRQRDTVDKLRGIKNLNEVMEERLTAWQRGAVTVAAIASSEKFLVGHAVAFSLWILFNLSRGARGPDPFPFPFLCFWSSCEAIFLSLFIMVSQSMQSQKDRLRTELEYQVALKAQYEIMQLHRKMDDIPQMIVEQLTATGKSPVADNEQEPVAS